MDRLLELTGRAEQSHFWFRGFRRFVQPEVARALKGRRSPIIVDCGCGTAANLEWLQPLGKAYGFDLSARGLAFGRACGRTRIARASVAAIPFPDRCADLATSFDVLQGLPDRLEREALAEMRRILKPGGSLVVTVAALEILRGSHSALAQEVRRYTPGRLRRLLEDAGFIVERLTFVHAFLFPIMLPVRVLQRWRNGTSRAGEFDIRVPPAPVNELLTAMTRVEAMALRWMDMPMGSTLLCRARTPDHDAPS